MRYVAIINAKSVRSARDRLLTRLYRMCPSDGLSIHWTHQRSEVRQLLNSELKRGVDRVLAVGGDGTIGCVAECLAGSGIPMGVVPCGTANDLANSLGIRSVNDAVAATRSGRCRTLDMIRINDRLAITTVGVGLGAAVVEWKRRVCLASYAGRLAWAVMGVRMYAVAALVSLLNARQVIKRITLEFPTASVCVNALSLTVSNFPRLGQAFCPAPGAVPNDGLLDVCVIKGDASIVTNLRTVLSVRDSGYVDTGFVGRSQVNRITIRSACELPAFADGEVIDSAKFFDIEVIPAAIMVLALESSGGS